ncbi:MAG TPA: alpha/beta hydrolase [Stellaceae bacterium]|nr:alpha/beta hydrolase [Stellaceae bacterium]
MTPPPPNAVIEIAAADGAIIRLRRHGNAQGPRLFVSHGNGFAVDGYFPFWRHFLDRFEVVGFDMRSHGQNPVGDIAEHDYAHMAQDIETVWQVWRDEFAARPAAGLFHSMSAQSAALQAMATGQRFEALVLFDPPNVPPEGDPAREPMLVYLRRLAEWAAGRRSHFADPAELARDYAATGAGRDWIEGTHELVARSVLRPEPTGGWRLACPREFESSMYAQGIPLGLWPKRSDVPGAVKLIGADPERTRPSPTALSNRALARDGGFDYVAIPGTGHLLQLERPDACVEVTLAFLEGLGLR